MDAMLPRMSVRSRCSSWSVSTTVSGMVSRHCLVHSFVPHAKTSVQFVFTSVRCRRSASYRSVVKDYQFFLCAVRSAARQHNVCCIGSTHSISCVFNCVLISSVVVCVSTFCVVCRARQPSTYHRCACVLCSVRDKHRQLNR